MSGNTATLHDWSAYQGTTADGRSISHYCDTCGYWHTGMCRRIKLIEYHENGTVKKMEYFDDR